MRPSPPLFRVLALITSAACLGVAQLALAQQEPAPDAEATTEASDIEVDEVAEEAAPEPEIPPLVLRANELMATHDGLNERLHELEVQLASADQSDELVIDRQIIDVKLEFLDLMGKLVENVLAQEKLGLDASELRAMTSQDMLELPPAILEHITGSEVVILSIRNKRDEAAIDDVLQIEQQLEREVFWLDRLYRAYVENLTHRDAIGLDTTKPGQDLRERLSERTKLQAARLELVIEQLKELGVRIAEQPDDSNLGVEKAALEARRKTLTASLSRLAKQMDVVGLDATTQQQLLITSTGEVTSDIFKPDVALGLAEKSIERARAWVRENGPGAGFKLIIFIVIVAVSRVLSGITRRILRRALTSSRMQASQLLQRMMIAGISNSVLLMGILIGLSQLGFELGPLLAGLGIAGFVLGFALQDSLSNFAAGMMILGYRPFDLGDVIDAAGVRGTVHHMSLVNTTILTFDNRTLIIPNNKIWGDVVTNLTNQDKRRVDLMVRIGYEQDVDRVEDILRDVLSGEDRILADPPPVVRLHEFGRSAMEIIVRPWATTEDYWDVYWSVIGAIKRRLDAEGIPIAVPQSEIRMRPEPADD